MLNSFQSQSVKKTKHVRTSMCRSHVFGGGHLGQSPKAPPPVLFGVQTLPTESTLSHRRPIRAGGHGTYTQNYTLDTAFSVQPFLRPNYPGCPPPIGGGLRYNVETTDRFDPTESSCSPLPAAFSAPDPRAKVASGPTYNAHPS